MRHGLQLSKLSRPTAHRMLMLRNLVSSLLRHEQVSTTLPKAKAAQKLADQVIQWGKRGGKDNRDRANAFLLNAPETLDPLFTTLAARYADRPGGYTRILRAGYRQGDNAPLAVLELVDHQNDLRFESAAKTAARELALRTRRLDLGPEAFPEFRTRVEQGGRDAIAANLARATDVLGPVTRKNVDKALRFRRTESHRVPVDATSTTKPLSTLPSASSSSSSDDQQVVKLAHPATLFLDRVYHHYLASLAEFSLSSSSSSTLYHPDPNRTVSQLTQRLHPRESKPPPKPVQTVPMAGKKFFAGERTDGYHLAADAEVEVARGGPISRAKGDWSKRGLDRKRRVVSEPGPSSSSSSSSPRQQRPGTHATDEMDRLERELEQRL
ncbi:hypothetical protein JCM11491_003814 [Sporobolomyces phaffii]